ncbi:protein mono-ADP-ribosyltransferase TIPARP isoform X2 [Oncorhynchus kisutch]|nr:protein mono-ADP-ribosyltransferase TIPARP isoform X2 [Oncorhynchus kisutch]XP_020346439.1 protein mono-ADP-ribosyltransferase TIPARP isoform X2 [Oncorhynchus kisutch]
MEVPSDTNTSLPVWDAMHSQQVDVVWTVTPYSINVRFTPLPSKSGQTTSASNTLICSPGKSSSTTRIIQLSSGPSSALSQTQMIIQPLPQQMTPTKIPPSVLLTFPQSTLFPQPGAITISPHKPQNMTPGPVKTTSLILPLPVIITQPQPVHQPTTPAQTQAQAASTNQPPGPSKTAASLTFHTNTSGDIQICDHFLTYFCRTGSNCKQHHTPYPFHWQLWCINSHQWVDFTPRTQVNLERAYCNVNREEIGVKEGTDMFTLHFDNMTLKDGEKYDRVRRLQNTTDPTKNPHLYTRWCFFWWNNLSWTKYKDDVSKILLDKRDAGELECRLHILAVEYKVDFISMIQTNVTTGFQRAIRLRPFYRSLKSLRAHLRTGILLDGLAGTSTEPSPANFSVDPLGEFSTWYPPVWTPSSAPDQDYSMVDVPANTQAFQKVHRLFHKTLSETRVEIVSLHQIQNVLHWDKFQRYKEHMRKRGDTKEDGALERHLFHGTVGDFIEDICHNNFDPRVSGVNGFVYGYGSYFARDASYSNTFAAVSPDAGVRHMFLAKVLVGKVSVGKCKYRRPPPVRSTKEDYNLYDTCVDQLVNPTIFVVFDRCQCYPYYLIKYKELLVVDVNE